MRIAMLSAITMAVILASLAATAAAAPAGPMVRQASAAGTTPPLRDLAAAAPRRAAPAVDPAREVPLRRLPRTEAAGRAYASMDPVLQDRHAPRVMPAPLITFDGVSNLDGVHPPDPNGDVGPDHYICMVNMHFCIYDKVTGTNLIAPMLMSELFAAAGFPAPASTSDDGDPVVLYDHLADRWFISQFIVSVSPCHEVIGVSQTGDPLGAWNLYDFEMPNTKMNDYPKFGVWPDGYYMTDNQFAGNSWGGAGVFVFERDKMLAGDPDATYQYIDLATVNINFGGMLPADLDGPLPPSGAPCYFAMIDDDSWGMSPVDTLYTWEFHVDWDNPANTTFGDGGQPNYTNEVAAFDSAFSGGRNNIPQPGTSQKLDAIADRLMHRLQYRNFGGHESLTVCHTVDTDGADHAGVRYYEMRRTLPAGTFAIHEQATFAPDGDHRWMGSAALDGYGNLAVGYSVSGTGTYPSVRYAGRMVYDATGGLHQGEAELWAGAGSQTSPYARWGDYSMLAVDPVDNVTFWYISEYLPSTSYAGWRTRIGSFRLGSPEIGMLRGTVTNLLTGAGVAGARVFTTNGYGATATAGGQFSLNLPTGTHAVAATADGYFTSAYATVSIQLNETNFLDLGIAPIPLRITPRAAFSGSGTEGGPFAPASQAYLLSNASLATLSWTATWSQAWVEVTPRGGDLPAGAATSVVAAWSTAATFLAPGSFTDTMTFTNHTDGRAETRGIALSVTAFDEPVWCEDFAAGLPAGWTNIDTAGTGAGWSFDDPGGRGNLTGGDGIFAIADSWAAGKVRMDTTLQSGSGDYRSYASLSLQFNNDYYYYSGSDGSNEIADVDVSANGAAGPWSNLWRKTSSVRGPGVISLDLTEAAAGHTNVMVRFHYYNAYYDNWWQVDDVCVRGAADPAAGALGIQPPAGLSAAGYYPGPYTPERVYRLANASGAPLGWTAACSQAWCEVRPAGGELAAGASQDITARVAAATGSLLPGAYSGTLIVSNITEGVARTRSIDLGILEPLALAPAGGFHGRGLEGGPFTPTGQVYALANSSLDTMDWTAGSTSAWLAISPADGTLAPMATQQVAVSLVNTQLIVPGTYVAAVAFSNLITQSALLRSVTVTVIEITGDIAVFDSVAPTNDLLIPFGTVTAATPRTEHIVVCNTDPPGGRDLSVQNIFFGYYQDDFSSGTAAGWVPDVDANWSVVGNAYRARSAAQEFMTSVYNGGQTWGDAAVEVDVWRQGYAYNSQGLAFRTSADFDADGIGQGYLFLIAAGYYSVWWQDGGSYAALQAWTASSAIKTSATATNRLTFSAVGSQFRLYANGTLVWTGSDTHRAAGTLALLTYTVPTTVTTGWFDNVSVGMPRTDTLALGRKQVYLNANSLVGSQPECLPRGGAARRAMDMPRIPDVPDAPDAVGEPFSFANLPALPATVAPGESFTFDVTYAPRAAGANTNVVTILSNDNEDPWVQVNVNGRAAAGGITGRVTAIHSGAPLARATVTAANGTTNLYAVTDTNGGYRLNLLIGSWTVSASAANYATGTVAGLVISNDMVLVQDFALAGAQLFYAPTGITATLAWSTQATNTLWLTNTGPLAVAWQAYPVTRSASGHAPVSIPAVAPPPAATAAAAAMGRAPAHKPVESSEPIMAAPERELCYGIDMLNNQFVSFYTDGPGTFTTIGYTDGNLVPAITFLDDDFGRVYGLDLDMAELITLDTSDGSKTVIGAATPAAGHVWTSLAAAPDGTLYGVSYASSLNKLYRIDPATGAATFVGDITGATMVIGIAVHAMGAMYGLDIATDMLLRIDPATGAGTAVGSVGFNANYVQGMDFDDASGTLYLAAYNDTAGRGELRVADLATGATALIGPFQGDTEMNIAVASSAQAAWVTLATNASTLAPESTTAVQVIFDTTAVPNTPSTNEGYLVFNGSYVNTVPDMPLSLVIIPDPLGVEPFGVQVISGSEGGPFLPVAISYAITNRSGGALDWTLSGAAAWLDVAPTNGALLPGGSGSITASANAVADTLAVGIYTSTLALVNQDTGVISFHPVTLSVRPIVPDYFTEMFTTNNDLSGLALTLTTNGSIDFYAACLTPIASFPTDPAGSTPVVLTDDSSVQVNLLGGAAVQLYGENYTNLFIGSNGYLTFGAGDTTYTESMAAHFNRPRVSALFKDLNPATAGSVSWTQLADRVVVTYQGVPEWGLATSNRFQVELFFDGAIRVAWLDLAARGGLAGISAGDGIPAGFQASHLSAYPACGLTPTNYTITATAGEHGMITPAGAVAVAMGAATNFLVQSDTFFHITDIRTNGASIGYAFGSITTNFLFWWSNIVAAGAVHATLGPDLAHRGTPVWWLASHGWTQDFSTAEDEDPDADSFWTWQEYLADTLPRNPTSYPRVEISLQGLLFSASTGRLYDVQANTNPAASGWYDLYTNLPGTGTMMTLPLSTQQQHLLYRFWVGPPPGE